LGVGPTELPCGTPVGRRQINLYLMVRRGFLGLFVLATLSAGVATGCGSQSSEGGGNKRVRIGALYLDAQGFYGGIRKGIQVGAATQSLQLIGQNSQGDAARESSFMTTLIGSEPDAIIMSPVSETGSIPVVRQAADDGIPVVCYNTCISGAAARKYVKALVTTDQVMMGEQVGELSARYFRAKHVVTPHVAILNCDVYAACRQRKAGFQRILSARVPGVRYVTDRPGVLTDEAARTAADIVTAKPGIDALYATNEGGTLGALQGIQATRHAGRTVVLGSDIGVQIAEAMLAHPETLVLTVGQEPQRMGRVAVQQALRAARGEQGAQFETYIPTTEFTSDDRRGILTWLAAHKDGLP
jgi:ABC-type sugar transport system substrate-binding protein